MWPECWTAPGGRNKATPEPSALQMVVEKLKKELHGRGWAIWHWLLDAQDYGLPQSRPRVYICGRKQGKFTSAGSDLRCPSSFLEKPRSLRLYLDPTVPNIPPHGLPTLRQVQNLQGVRCLLERELKDPALRGRTVVFDVSRASGKTYRQYVRKDDVSICLTAGGTRFFVLSLGEGLAGPWTFHRFLTKTDRAALQGFGSELLHTIATETQATRMFGNSMAVPCIGVALACTLQGLRQ